MIVALYILIAMIVVGAILYLHFRITGGQDIVASSVSETTQEESAECCGMHITCERDSLMSSMSDTIEYYDDEELDRFRGRTPDQYDDKEIEEFRSVLLTLLPDDIAGWGRSIQLRGIELPVAVRDELLMIVSETRASRNITH